MSARTWRLSVPAPPLPADRLPLLRYFARVRPCRLHHLRSLCGGHQVGLPLVREAQSRRRDGRLVVDASIICGPAIFVDVAGCADFCAKMGLNYGGRIARLTIFNDSYGLSIDVSSHGSQPGRRGVRSMSASVLRTRGLAVLAHVLVRTRSSDALVQPARNSHLVLPSRVCSRHCLIRAFESHSLRPCPICRAPW
jgi:hypothetical protein